MMLSLLIPELPTLVLRRIARRFRAVPGAGRAHQSHSEAGSGDQTLADPENCHPGISLEAYRGLPVSPTRLTVSVGECLLVQSNIFSNEGSSRMVRKVFSWQS